nr:uncharacterized protein LOC109154451 [Ipomoea trifida]
MYQGNNQQREEPPKESMEDKMVRMFSELRHDVTNMRQEWKQDLRQEISTIRQEVSNLRQENNASLRHLETQVAQNSKALAERPQGTLPSTTINNPRERVQAVTLRSGKELPEPTLKKSTISKNPIEEEKIEEIIEVDKEQEKESSSLPSIYASNEEEASTSSSTATATQEKGAYDEDVEVSDAQALEYVSQIKRVLELLKKNRDMVFGECSVGLLYALSVPSNSDSFVSNITDFF